MLIARVARAGNDPCREEGTFLEPRILRNLTCSGRGSKTALMRSGHEASLRDGAPLKTDKSPREADHAKGIKVT